MFEELALVTTLFPALLPEGVAMLDAARPHNAAAARRARQATDEPATIGVFVQHAAHASRPAAADLVRIGCAAVVEEVVQERGQLLGLRVRGLARVELLDVSSDGAVLLGSVRVIDEATAGDPFVGAQLDRVRARLLDAVIEPELRAALDAQPDPGRFADLLAGGLADLSLEQRLAFLTTARPVSRLELVDQLLHERSPAPASDLGRVWAALRGPLSAVPGFSSLRGRARAIDRATLADARLRDTLDELLRRQPFLVFAGGDSQEQEARRESLLELTTALPTLEALRGLAGDEPALAREIAAAIAFLHAAAAREHAAIERGEGAS